MSFGIIVIFLNTYLPWFIRNMYRSYNFKMFKDIGKYKEILYKVKQRVLHDVNK